jgi:hypothetical protein
MNATSGPHAAPFVPSAEDFAEVAPEMLAAKRWLLRRGKVPYYVDGTPRHGPTDTPEDRERLASVEDALAALRASPQPGPGGFTGLGFALGPDGTTAPNGSPNHWQGIDLDSLPQHPELAGIVDELPGYTEASPSGQGLHAIGYGRRFNCLGSNGTGTEAYCEGRYFTLTGRDVGLGRICDLAPFVETALAAAHGGASRTRERTADAGVEFNGLGLRIDGRERRLRDVGWALGVGLYEDALKRGETDPPAPSGAALDAEIEAAFSRYERDTKSRLPPTPGRSNADRLEAEGRGITAFRKRVLSAMEKWQTEVREAALESLAESANAGQESREDPSGDGKAAEDRAPFGRPFVWRDPAKIPPRRWVLKPAYPRGYITADAGSGGVGKTSLVIAEGVAMASGRALLGVQPERAGRVFYWNGEDELVETERRIHAALAHYELSFSDLGGRLFYGSGRERELIIARETPNGVTVFEPVVDELLAFVTDNQIDAVIIDPFVASHDVPENDNRAIDRVAKTWAKIAGKTDGAIKLVHHFRKTGGAEVSVEDARGAVALIAAARHARALRVMTDDEAQRLGVEAGDRWSYVRIDDGKSNLTPPADKIGWIRLESVSLANGDYVQVAMAWKAPDPFAGVTPKELQHVQQTIQRGRGDAPSGWRTAKPPDHAAYAWRASVQAGSAWAGYAVAQALGLDLRKIGDEARAKALLKAWLKSEALQVVKVRDAKGREVPFVEVGEPVLL